MKRQYTSGAPYIGALFVCLLGWAGSATAQSGCPAERIDDRAHVEYVHDGDTLHLSDGRKLRLIGINTPELGRDGRPSEPLAEAARDRLRELLPRGSKIHLRLGKDRRDRHGRVLAHVFAEDGNNVTARLLEQGLGFAIAISPNLWSHSCYFAAEARARQSEKGVWAEPYYRARSVTRLQRADGGFRRIRGEVRRVGESRKAIWLNFDAPVAIRIGKDDLEYFEAYSPVQLHQQEIIARGWLSYYRGRGVLHVSHPAMIRIVD